MRWYSLVAIYFLFWALSVFFDVAYQACLVRLVRRDQLVRGNSALEGHRYDWTPEPGATLLLCTDGVDGVVAPDALGELGLDDNPRLALDRLFDAIFEAGAPDNATAILARRA